MPEDFHRETIPRLKSVFLAQSSQLKGLLRKAIYKFIGVCLTIYHLILSNPSIGCKHVLMFCIFSSILRRNQLSRTFYSSHKAAAPTVEAGPAVPTGRWDGIDSLDLWKFKLPTFRQSFFTAIYDPFKILNEWMENKKHAFAVLRTPWSFEIHKQKLQRKTTGFWWLIKFNFSWVVTCYRLLKLSAHNKGDCHATGGLVFSTSDVSSLRTLYLILSSKM